MALHDLVLRKSRRSVGALHRISSSHRLGISVQILDKGETEWATTILIAGELGFKDVSDSTLGLWV